LYVSNLTLSIALLKLCIYSYWSVGRKPGVWGSGREGIGARIGGSGYKGIGRGVGTQIELSGYVGSCLGKRIDGFRTVERFSD